MLNKFISIGLICLICLTAISPMQLRAQTRENQIAKNDAVKSTKKVEPLDLSQFFVRPVTKDSPVQLDIKKLQKENLNAAQKTSLSKGQKTALYIGIGAAIAATIVIIVVARKKESDNGCVVCLAVGLCPQTPPPTC